MSDNYILKLSAETEAEKYLAVVIPEMKLTVLMICLCYLFISKDFSPKKLWFFKCFHLREHIGHFPNYRVNPIT